MSTSRRLPPTPAMSSRGCTPAPDQLKMRTSCHSCAFSKLKCSGDKPTCARCAKRGLPCEYVAAKRGGRKPTVKKTTNTADPHAFEVLHTALQANGTPRARVAPQAVMYATPSRHSANTTTNNTNAPPSPSLSPCNNIQAMPQTEPPSFDPEMLSSFDPGFTSTSTITDSDLSDYFPVPEDVDMLTADFFTSDFDSSAPDFNLDALSNQMDGTTCDLFADFLQEPSSKVPGGSNTDFHSYQPARAQSKPSPSCLIRALELLKHYSPSACHQPIPPPAHLPAVIAQNGAIIEAASAMLECSCSQDGYQLVVIALIVFKALRWYNAAVRQEAQQHSRPQTKPSDKAIIGDDEDSSRAAAQAVLIESHRVRKLIEQTSLKLRARAEADETEVVSQSCALPFSAAMYSQLDAALMGQLRVLSLDMINRLNNH